MVEYQGEKKMKIKCQLMPYEIEWSKKHFPSENLTDNDGYLCPLRENGICKAEEHGFELAFEFNLNGVFWCVPRSKTVRRVLVGDKKDE